MISKNHAVFRFLLDIKDFVNKARKLIQINNQISGSTTKASGSMDKLAVSTKKTGDTMAANAVNFQTATQGMLNLTTAGVQTYTSFSNLDRAGNRLAQAQIGVSRATDLLNNKQLRLNELVAKGQGNSQKAVLLTNELATARADLLVKTDKLKIEEGALFDIQLLFVTNIANVMISSLQTIVSLKQAHIGTTIKQIVQERLLSTTIFSKTVPAFAAATAAGSSLNVMTKQVINTQRLLLIGIPGIGTALLAVSVAVQAYTENWGGFRDMVQSVLPFMRDQKKLLGDVTDELDGTADAAAKLNGEFDNQLDVLFKLPDKYVLAKETIESLSKAYGVASKEAKEFNKEVAKNPQSFRVATQQGGFLPTLPQDVQVSGSNVIRVEGDAVNTAKSIRSSSISRPTTNDLIRMASVGVLPSAYATSGTTPQEIDQPIITNTSGGIYRQNSIYDLVNVFDPTTQAHTQAMDFVEYTVNGIKRNLTSVGNVAREINEVMKEFNIPITLPVNLEQITTRLHKGFVASRAQIIGIDPETEQQILDMRKMISDQISGKRLTGVGTLTNIFGPRSGAGKFVGSGAFFTGLKPAGMGGTELLQALIKQRDDLIQERRTVMAGSKRFVEINNLISGLDPVILKGTTDPNTISKILTHDKLVKQMGLEQFIVDPDKPEAFEEFKEKSAKKREQAELRNLMQIADALVKQDITDTLAKDAAAVGLSSEELIFRRRIGGAGAMGGLKPGISGIGKDILVFGHDITSDQLSFLESQGKVSTFTDSKGKIKYKFEPIKVKEAKEIRRLLEAGDTSSLPTDTPFDRLVKDTFGRKGGVTFRSDDPKFRDISDFGENRAAIFTKRMIDPITGEDLGMMGTDIGRVADSISLEEGFRIAELQSELSGFNARSVPLAATPMFIKNFSDNPFTAKFGDVVHAAFIKKARTARDAAELDTRLGGKTDEVMSIITKAGKNYRKMQVEHALGGMEFGAGFFKSAGATAAYQVPRGSIRASDDFYRRIAIKDANTNRLRFGGRLRDGFSIWDEGAVIGGYGSAKAYSEAGKKKFFADLGEASTMMQFFGVGIDPSRIRGRSSRRSEYNRVLRHGTSIKEALTLAGLGYRTINTELGRRPSLSRILKYRRDLQETISFNSNQYAKANVINLLQQDYELTGFTGTTMSLPSLQDSLAAEDERMKAIGLNRTEAFQIIDTSGRGREEIDDRIRFKDRMNSISTGVSVL